jgi:hypothetical protein
LSCDDSMVANCLWSWLSLQCVFLHLPPTITLLKILMRQLLKKLFLANAITLFCTRFLNWYCVYGKWQVRRSRRNYDQQSFCSWMHVMNKYLKLDISILSSKAYVYRPMKLKVASSGKDDWMWRWVFFLKFLASKSAWRSPSDDGTYTEWHI